MIDLNFLSERDIARKLLSKIEPTYDIPLDYLTGECRQAGVLIPFIRCRDSWEILFIRRSELESDKHSGQVAFVGGQYEQEDESLLTTALRETQEEIGILPEHVTVLGELSHHHTVSHYRITPVVGCIPWPYSLSLAKEEVAHTFTIPLNWLADENNYEIRHRELTLHKGPVPVVYFKEYAGELLWGATARMALSLTQALLRD